MGLSLALTLSANAVPGGWNPPDLPEAVASFGAVSVGGALYVYGGHVGRVHAHSIENISPAFRRLALRDGAEWEELARGPRLQGAILVSDGESVYRVGGFAAENATAEETEVLHSSASFARYVADEDRWEPLPDLPAGRSSHDAVVHDRVLYVVGGWTMRGPDEDSVWADSVLALDLDGGDDWRTIPAPFRRRALAAGARDGRLYALGGLADGGSVSAVDVLDLASGEWSEGPKLPPGPMRGFGAAAASHRDQLFVTQTSGKAHRLSDDGSRWEPVAELDPPRMMPRLVAVGNRLFAIGGANRDGHLKSIESLDIPSNEPEWTGFRGGGEPGVSRAARLPLEWSDDTAAWRARTTGFGQSSPVVAGGAIFLTSLEGALKETNYVTALDLDDGSERWRRTFGASEEFEWNDYVSKAAPTPAVDEERLYALFDSGDLLALTHDGETVWNRNLSAEFGSFGGNHGVGGSVLRTPDAVVVLLLRRTYSYLLAVDPATGETLWKTDREPGVGWSTPVPTPDRNEIVVSASGRVEGFDAGSGERRWSYAGFSGNNVPSPTVTDDLVLIAGLEVEANFAIRRGAEGTLDETVVAWAAGSASNFGSPLVYGECAYWVNQAGAARCLDLESGDVRWTHRLPASTWASPLGFADRVYFFGEDGVTQVLRASGDEPEVLATNSLTVDAPVTGYAAVNDAIVIRAGHDVIRVGRTPESR